LTPRFLFILIAFSHWQHLKISVLKRACPTTEFRVDLCELWIADFGSGEGVGLDDAWQDLLARIHAVAVANELGGVAAFLADCGRDRFHFVFLLSAHLSFPFLLLVGLIGALLFAIGFWVGCALRVVERRPLFCDSVVKDQFGSFLCHFPSAASVASERGAPSLRTRARGLGVMHNSGISIFADAGRGAFVLFH
jgi:hypothetical protein